MNDEAHPAESLRFALLKLTGTLPAEDSKEAERCIDALFAYWREPRESKVKAAEDKVAAIKYTVELKDREIKELTRKAERQGKLLEEAGIRESMLNLYHRLGEAMHMTRKPHEQ